MLDHCPLCEGDAPPTFCRKHTIPPPPCPLVEGDTLSHLICFLSEVLPTTASIKEKPPPIHMHIDAAGRGLSSLPPCHL